MVEAGARMGRRPRWQWWAAAILLLLPLLAGGGWVVLVALALQPAPRVGERPALPLAEVGRVKMLLEQSWQPDAPAGLRRLALSPRDVDVLWQEAAARLLKGAGLFATEPGRAAAILSAPVQALPGVVPRPWPLDWMSQWRPWLNVTVMWAQAPDGLPVAKTVMVGSLQMPDWLVSRAPGWLRQQGRGGAGRLPWLEPLWVLADQVQRVELSEQAVTVAWAWEPSLPDRLQASVLPAADAQRVQAYLLALTAADAAVAPASVPSPGGPRHLATLLPEMFTLARQRTLQANAPGAAAQENRAALVALALYATQRDLGRWVAPAPGHSWPAPRPVWLRGRDDFAQHWLVSAVLASGTGGRLADALGAVKEMADTHGGSGFSFNDIAADVAGSRIGQRAVHEAELLQRQLAMPLVESDFMPDVADLPEFLTVAAFEQRYGNRRSAAYQAMLADIERRVAACRLAQPGTSVAFR